MVLFRLDRILTTYRVASWFETRVAALLSIVRNDAVHEMTESSEADINEMAEFVEAFLVFVFTMPKKYELRASRRKQA